MTFTNAACVFLLELHDFEEGCDAGNYWPNYTA